MSANLCVICSNCDYNGQLSCEVSVSLLCLGVNSERRRRRLLRIDYLESTICGSSSPLMVVFAGDG